MATTNRFGLKESEWNFIWKNIFIIDQNFPAPALYEDVNL